MHMKFLTMEDFEDMVETITKTAGLWAIVSSLMIAFTYNSSKPVSILLTRPLKRHKTGLKLKLQ